VRFVVAAVLLASGTFGIASSAFAKTSHEVVRLDLSGAVQPLSASYVVDGIRDANARHAEAVLLRIDTPGGLDSSMRKIVGSILDSKIPVVCWVGPPGARAASAGTFILLACNTATMADGTNVGAAHPVGVQGQVMDHKVTNDAAAFIRSIAEKRHRNAGWAERAVRQSVSLSAPEALRLHVIDGVASGPSAALRAAGIEKWTIHREAIPFGRGLIGTLVDPNLAFLLFIIGLGGLLVEILHPGLSVPGVVGLLSLVVALVMFELLPVNVAGLVLLVAGVAFLLIEAHKPGFSLPGIAGIISLVLGGLFLFDAGTLVRVSRPFLAVVVALDALFLLVFVRAAWRARRMPPPDTSIVGAEGVATSDLDPVGTVRVRSEQWTAESAQGKIPAGTKIHVVDHQGLRLRVESEIGGS
jgi:membrane-bound serine protease (ClpP class)